MKNIEYLIFKKNVYINKCYSFDEVKKYCDDQLKYGDRSTDEFTIYVFNNKSDDIRIFKYMNGSIMDIL